MTDLVERLRARADAFDSGQGTPMMPLDREAADEIERLKRLLKAKVTPGYELLADQIEKRDAEIERLRALSSDMLVVLNACRITIKNRDQRPDEMKLLDAIKIVIANAEDVLRVKP